MGIYSKRMKLTKIVIQKVGMYSF